MTSSPPAIVYTSHSDRGFANAFVAGLSARGHFGSQTAEMRLFAHHTTGRGRALVLLPLGGIGWTDTQLAALDGAVLVGDLSGSTSMIRGLAAGARTAINSHLPFDTLLDELHTALHVDDAQPALDNFSLVQRIRVRAQESARVASLTDREFEILGFLHAGSNVDRIARTAHITATTVRAHIRSILQKLAVHSQLEACALLHRSGHDARRNLLEGQIGRY